MRRTALPLLVLLALALLGAGAAYAHVAPGGYIYSPLLYRRRDPVNLVVLKGTTSELAARRVERAMEWPKQRGGIMYFQDHGELRRMDAQRAGPGTCVRCDQYHVRVLEGDHPDPETGAYAQGSAHYEEWRGYCHVVLSFDAARDHLAANLAASPPARAFENNVLPSPQCDGTQPHGDGVVYQMDLP